jgi:uncharacterized protein (UPF0276 family)
MIPRPGANVKESGSFLCYHNRMIKLGMTDCPALRALLERGTLELDYIEVHGPHAEAARQVYPLAPMLLHNALYQWSLAHPDGLLNKNGAVLTRQLMEITRSPWYSLHLGFSSAQVDFVGDAMLALTSVLPSGVILERSLRLLADLKALLGDELPVLVENLDYNPGGAYDTVCEPQFICRAVEEAGVGLLLDLAHARISAAALRMEVKDYLLQLPLTQVRQVHINHPQWNGERWWDAHEALQEEDEALLEWVLARCQPWALTLEYNRDEELILSQTARLRQILGQP